MGSKRKGKGRRRLSRRVYLFACIAVLLGGVCTWFGEGQYQAYTASYQKYMSMARQGEQQLQLAVSRIQSLSQNPFDANAVAQAQQNFSSALTSFDEVDTALESLPGVSGLIPVLGTRLNTALHLALLAMNVSQAGIAGCSMLHLLITRFQNPLNLSRQGITMADMGSIDQDFQQVAAALNGAMHEANLLQPADLQFDPHISKLFVTYQKDLPQLQTWIVDAQMLMPVLPVLLGIGKPGNYLIEVLDSTELRPGGGFIGNYGIATFSGGTLASVHITDVDLLDHPFVAAGHRIAFPPAYSWFNTYFRLSSWSLRDSNLDADFPTDARYGELNYVREGGNVPLQGVIALTPALIQGVLAITGPITIPEYHETVTAQNLIDLIHFHQLAPGQGGKDYIPSADGHSSQRKRFTELLAEHFMARVHQLSSNDLPKFVALLFNALHTKDLQVYFNAAPAEAFLHHQALDDTIRSSGGDSLFVVDANVSGNKASRYIISTSHDSITIDASGNVIHHLTLTYAWTIAGQIYGHARYQDYVRVYVPTGSILQTQTGWQPHGTSSAFGKAVWAGFFTLFFGQTRTITLTWKVPKAAQKDASGWNYTLLIQKQAGASWIVDQQLTLPSCATSVSAWGGLVVSNSHYAALHEALNQVTSVGVQYAC